MKPKFTIETIIGVCEEAGALILQYYKKDHLLKTELKEDQTPVTMADKAADALIRERLEAILNIPILSEETADDLARLGSDCIWLVDPIDGTKDFIAGTDEFVVNIALIEDQRPVFGAMYLPVYHQIYFAFKDGGAFCGTKVSQPQSPEETKWHFEPIKVSDATTQLVLLKSRFSKSARHEALVTAHSEGGTGRIAEVRSVGSCYKGCLIAQGRAHGYYRFGPTSEWVTTLLQQI